MVYHGMITPEHMSGMVYHGTITPEHMSGMVMGIYFVWLTHNAIKFSVLVF